MSHLLKCHEIVKTDFVRAENCTLYDEQGRCYIDLDANPFDQLGGFVFEPGGSGSCFVQLPPLALVRQLVERTWQAGGLVAANEITTGMGRTGRWFGFLHYDIQPDIVSIGKGLGNGYPVSAVAVKAEVAEKLEHSGLRYAQSHQNDPLGCAVASEVIAVLREDGWIERGDRSGAVFLSGLADLAGKYPIVKEARGQTGLWSGGHLAEAPKTQRVTFRAPLRPTSCRF